MNLLPKDFIKDCENFTQYDAFAKMDLFIRFRDEYLADCIENHKKARQLRIEFSKPMRCSVSSIDHTLWIIRDYPANELMLWLKAGFSFGHIERANSIFGLSQYKDPASLICAAIEAGSENGDAMTVDELDQFALGHLETKTKSYKVNKQKHRVISSAMRLAPLFDWDAEKMKAKEIELMNFLDRWLE